MDVWSAMGSKGPRDAESALRAQWKERKRREANSSKREERQAKKQAEREEREARLKAEREAKALKAKPRNKQKRHDEGLLEATRMAQEVQNLLLDGGNFKLCLASLKAANHGQRWSSLLRAAKFLLDHQIFYVDMEGHYDADAWELAIVIDGVR